MPILSYQCHDCGLSQKKRTSKEVQEIRCECGGSAMLEVGSLSIGFSSAVKNDSGLVKAQDSGIESFDLDYDRVIGEDAQDKWSVIYYRKRAKIDLVDSTDGATSKDVMKMPDGTYAVKPNESEAFRKERLRRLNLTNTPNKQE